MATMERLFAEIFDRKSRIERQLYQQFESYGESLACNIIADGRRPPPWLLDLVPATEIFLDPGEYRQPSSLFRNTKRKTCSATWEFIKRTLPRDDSEFISSIHDFVIAPTVDKQNKSPHVVEEIHSACSGDFVKPTNLMAFESEIDRTSEGAEKIVSYVDTFENKAYESVDRHDGSKEGKELSEALGDFAKPTNLMAFESEIDCTSEGAEKIVSYVDTFENKAYESVDRHDGSKEGKELSEALGRACGCDIISILDTAGVKSSCDETMIEFKGSNIDLLSIVEDSIFRNDQIPSPANELASTTPLVAEEFLSVCSIDDVRLTNHMPFESQVDRTSSGAEKLFSNVDAFEKNACESNVHYDVSEEGNEPYNATQHLHRFDITSVSDTAGMNSICDETIPDFKISNINFLHTVEVTKDANIPSLPKEQPSSIPHVTDEILSESRDEVRTTNIVPCESEIHHTCLSAEKLFSHVDAFENKTSGSIGHHDGFQEGDGPYDIAHHSYSCDVTSSDIAGVKPSCDETMYEFDSSNIDLPYALDDSIVFKDAGIPSLVKDRASTTPHKVEEILSACSKDEVRPANFVPFESVIPHNSEFGVDAFEYKASESLGHHDGSEEDEEPYDAPYRCDITSISDIIGVNPHCDENMPEFEAFSIDLPNEEDNIVCKDADIPSLEKERAFVLEQLRQSRILPTPRSKPSMKNRIDIISNGFNSSPSSILKIFDLGFSVEHDDPDTIHSMASSSIKLMDMLCNNGTQMDGPAFESSLSLSSSARIGSELQSHPLTPPAIKFSHGRVSGKRSSSSVNVSSNPELICFRIDENSSTTEENADAVQVGFSTRQGSSRNIEVSTNSKPLSDVTSLYQNNTRLPSTFKEFVVRDSLESVNSDAESSLGFECVGKESNLENKENLRYTYAIKELRKATRTVSKMSERPRISCRSSVRIRNYQNIGKGCKPSNILSNISSFIPQIQEKQQQVLPLQRKKEIKVKALEAAEAAKRLEDQMKIEREKRKAALKLEREKLKQENAKLLKLKQIQKDEERKKKEDAAARKRQREDDERKVKDRKRRCIEETRTLQRERKDKLRCEKEKDIRQKAIDENQKGRKQRNDAVQKKLERGCDSAESQMAAEIQHCTIQLASTETLLCDDKIQALEALDEYKSFEKGIGGSNVIREAIEETVSATRISLESQSYEMSPYQTSDDEDMEEDSRHKKYIPHWARGESLGEIILANRQLDPKDIFCRKRSFNVSQVLTSRALKRRQLK